MKSNTKKIDLDTVPYESLVSAIQKRNPDYFFDHGLVRVQDYQRMRFPNGGAPCRQTIYSCIQSGELKGKKIGVSYFIDLDADKTISNDSILESMMQH